MDNSIIALSFSLLPPLHSANPLPPPHLLPLPSYLATSLSSLPVIPHPSSWSSGKPRSSTNPAESVITQQARPIAASSFAAPANASSLPPAPSIEPASALVPDESTTPAMTPTQASIGGGDESKASTPLPSPPFLLLSQEVSHFCFRETVRPSVLFVGTFRWFVRRFFLVLSVLR